MSVPRAIHYHVMNTLLWTRRQRPLHWARTRAENRGAVLMYHSVGEVDVDPWGLYVTPQNFAEHLDVLRSRTMVMALDELSAACVQGTLPLNSTAITFDDGYVNNLREARPLLEAADLPATVFIVNDGVDRAAEYWWDQVADVLLAPGTLPERIELGDGADGSATAIDLGRAAVYTEAEHLADHDYHDGDGTPSPRMLVYHQVWEALIGLSEPERESAIRRLADVASRPPTTRETHRPVTTDELQELNSCDLIDLGAHTLTHPLLPRLSAADQRREIIESKHDLETRLDAAVELFSYPFGGHDDTSVALALEAGFTTAVTTEAETASSRSQPLRIPRFDVKNWTGEEFEQRLTRWLRFR